MGSIRPRAWNGNHLALGRRRCTRAGLNAPRRLKACPTTHLIHHADVPNAYSKPIGLGGGAVGSSALAFLSSSSNLRSSTLFDDFSASTDF